MDSKSSKSTGMTGMQIVSPQPIPGMQANSSRWLYGFSFTALPSNAPNRTIYCRDEVSFGGRHLSISTTFYMAHALIP